jgi:hypothetical protein
VVKDAAPSRRALLSGAGALVLGGCGHGATARKAVRALPRPLMENDVRILGRALELERRTVAAYVAGIPLLSRPLRTAARQFLNEELQHTGELISLITAAGAKAGPRADSYALGHPRDAAGVLALLHFLEALQIKTYLQSIPRLSPGPVRAAVASILTVDSQHIAMVRLAQGQTPVPSAFVTGSE